MKLFVGVAVFLWLLCGAIGAWMLDDLELRHWDKIAKGPITLVRAWNDSPPALYPSGVQAGIPTAKVLKVRSDEHVLHGLVTAGESAVANYRFIRIAIHEPYWIIERKLQESGLLAWNRQPFAFRQYLAGMIEGGVGRLLAREHRS